MSKIIFNRLVLLSFLVSASTFAVGAYAGDIEISSPMNGAVIDGQAHNEIMFKVNPTPDGNHLHFYVDHGNPKIVREWQGTFTLPALSPGKHEVCIKEAMVNHVLTGLQKCIFLTAK